MGGMGGGNPMMGGGSPMPMGGGTAMPPPSPLGGPPGAGGMDGQQPAPQEPPQIEADNVWDALEQFLKGKSSSDDKDKEKAQPEKPEQLPQEAPQQQQQPQAQPAIPANLSNG